MLIEKIIGRTITNIYMVYGEEQGWLDTSECFIELDCNTIIDIPFGYDKVVWIKKYDTRAISIFTGFAGRQLKNTNRVYHLFERMKKALWGGDKDKWRLIQNRRIVDFIWFGDGEIEKGFIELENGFVITHNYMAPKGTGQAGLRYYPSLADLIEIKGNNYCKLSKGR